MIRLSGPSLTLRRRLLGHRTAIQFRHFVKVFKFNPDQLRDERGRWTGDTEDELDWPSDSLVLTAARGRRGLEAECKAQYDRDIFQCNMVGLPACYNQAMVRQNACLRGQPIPPLNY